MISSINNDNMPHRVVNICESLRDNMFLDDKPNDYYFELKYEDKAIISLVKIYQYRDDNDKIRHKKEYGEIEELHMSLKEYCNLLINIYESKLMIGATGDIRNEAIMKRIKILKIK